MGALIPANAETQRLRRARLNAKKRADVKVGESVGVIRKFQGLNQKFGEAGGASSHHICSAALLVPSFGRRPLSFDGAPMKRDFNVLVERDNEGYYVASVPSLPGCHTQAKSPDELMERIREAIELFLEVEGGNSEPLDFIGVQRVTVAA